MSEERQLVSALRCRQPGAFDEVYRRYAERIWRFLQRLTGGSSATEDLFQETWIAAARNVHRLREDTVLPAWLYTIARNRYRNALRLWESNSRRLAEFRSAPHPGPAAPDQAADARMRAQRANSAFARLPEAHREVLLLCLVEELDTTQVAGVLGVSRDVVRTRLSRARAELARQIEWQKEE
jgi:RNA polymerase sigma-70 factor, ECF subfamily